MIFQDIRYAIRTLCHTPAFTATALLVLALGIGANTAIFSVVNTVLLKPLTYPDAGRIVFFFLTTPGGPSYGGSATKYNVWRLQTQLFEDVSAYEYNGIGLNLTGGAYPEQVHGIRVSANYFHLLGAPVVQGRAFTADEDRPNGGRVVVLSYALWQRRFAGNPAVVGKTILLSGAPYQVVGILGPGFDTELDSPPDLWLPFQIPPNSNDHAQYFSVLARLRPGLSLANANARLQLATNEFRRQFPTMIGLKDAFQVNLFQDGIVSGVRSSLLVLSGAVSFVLLIACANVANLLLVRATGRKREIAVRAALGASRARIIRQLLTESVVLSFAGGALGLVLGMAGVRALLTLNPGNIPRIGQHGSAVALDARVLAFTVLVSIVSGILFGLAPALGVGRLDLSAALKESSGRFGSGLRQNRTRSLLVIGETALALVLLMGAALLIRTYIALRAVNPGFIPHQVLTMRMSLAGSRFAKTADVSQLIRDAVQQLGAIPGIARAAAAYSLPVEGAFGVPFNIVGRTPANGRYDGRGWLGASAGYFDVFRIPILRGRVFNDRDDSGAEPVAVVNQAFARRFWPKGDALGNRIVLGKGYGPEFEEPPREIVGVVGDVHDSGLNRVPGPMVYVPLAQVPDGITALASRVAPLIWIVRTRTEPHALSSVTQNVLRQASGGLPVASGSIRSMDEVVSQSTARQGFDMLLLTIFGGSALGLAAIGIYGLMAYSVQQRTQEIAIRIALGAASSHLRNMVLFEGMRLAAAGIAIGMAAALALTRLLAGFLFGVNPRDPLVFAAVPLLLSAVALSAVWLPARRATRTDPARALR